jgi:hypothetical protein
MITSAWVDISVANNGTWADAFQFGTPGDLTWSFTGQSFTMDIKASRNDTVALYTLTSAGGTIVVDDPVNRILNFDVPYTIIQSDLPVGEYVYDLIMFDTSSPPIRVPLMQGRVFVKQGVSED